MRIISGLSRLSLPITIAALLAQACAPNTPSVSSVDVDAGVAATTPVLGCDSPELSPEEQAECANPSKAIPIVYLGIAAAGLILVAVAQQVMVTVRVRNNRGWLDVQYNRPAFEAVRYRGHSSAAALAGAGVAHQEADRADDHVRVDDAGVPLLIDRVCSAAAEANLQRQVHNSNSCGAQRPRINDCRAMQAWVRAMNNCLNARRNVAAQCYPNGGAGPMGAGDSSHNYEYCSALNYMNQSIDQSYNAGCGGMQRLSVPGCWAYW